MSRHTIGRQTEFVSMTEYFKQKAEYERQLQVFKRELKAFNCARTKRFHEIFMEDVPFYLATKLPPFPKEPTMPFVLCMTPGKKAARFTYNTIEVEPESRRHEERSWKFDKNGAPTSEFKRHEIRCQRQIVQASQAFEPLDLSEEAYENEAMRMMDEDYASAMQDDGYMDPFDSELTWLQDYEESRNHDLDMHYSREALVEFIYDRCTWWSGRSTMDACFCHQCKEAVVEADQFTAREATRKWVEAKKPAQIEITLPEADITACFPAELSADCVW